MGEVVLELACSGPGLTLVTGPNGAGKSSAARALAARVAGARLLSAESQQAFYEAQLAADESNFKQGIDTSSSVAELLREEGRNHPLFAAFRLEALWQRGYRLLSTGEGRKVLLLQAVLQAPTLLILDGPFDGLDRAACAELALAIVQIAESLSVVVVGTFDTSELPFAREALRELVVIGRSHAPRRAAPPVELGSFHEPLDPSVPSLCSQRKSTVLMVTHRADERLFWQERIASAILSLP